MVAVAILFATQFASGDAISVRRDFAAEFNGYYSFTLRDGTAGELICVVGNNIGTIGTGSRYGRIIEFKYWEYIVNIAYDRQESLVIFAGNPQYGKHTLFVFLEKPFVLHGEFSRVLPN